MTAIVSKDVGNVEVSPRWTWKPRGKGEIVEVGT
jgi:hypothetical protein